MTEGRADARRDGADPPANAAPETTPPTTPTTAADATSSDALEERSLFAGLPRLHSGWRVLTSIAVLTVCIWFFLHLDLRTVWKTLLHSNWLLLAVAAIANLTLHQGLKALRWHLMIVPHARVAFWRVYLYTLAGNAASHALPARAGEALRATLARRHGVPLPVSAGIQLFEAGIETLSLICVTLPLPWVLDLPPAVRGALQGLYIAGIAIALMAVLLATHGHRAGRFLAWLRKGGAALRSPRTVAVLAVTTIAARFVDGGILLLTLHAVGLDGNLWTAFLVILAVDAALILPTTPGGFGGFEAACVGALHLVGKEPEHALAFGIAYHALQQIPGMLAGAGVMLWARPGATRASRTPA